jgi:hypothetical protein
VSTLNVDKVDPSTGTALEIGSSGDTVTVPSGATFTVSGTMNASSITAGTVATARLGSGTASSSTVLYGDQTYKTEPGGGMVPIQTQESESTAANVILDNVFTSTYNKYRVIGFLVPATSGGNFDVFARTGGASGVTYAGSEYVDAFSGWYGNDSSAGGAITFQYYGGTNWTTETNNRSDSDSAYVAFDYMCYDPANEIVGRFYLAGHTTWHSNTDNQQIIVSNGHRLNTALAATGLGFTFSNGDVDEFSVTVYGVKDA